ncbi:MAG: twin-arginine translocase TatA/TatE family subunit [Phycisphaerae bacterium]|nr:twin-arginine translocase TatA/TatE family subunit [Phycisphaerae bacterium]
MPGTTEWIIILVIGLLIFGRRLPEVGRSLGKGIVEFKKGIKGIEDEIDTESSQSKPAELDQKASFSEETEHDAAPTGGKSPFQTDSGSSTRD